MKTFLPSRISRNDENGQSENMGTDRKGCSSRLRADSKNCFTFSKQKSLLGVQTENIPNDHTLAETIKRDPYTPAVRRNVVQIAPAANETGADKYAGPARLPDIEMRLLRQQAARQKSFVDLLIGLVPFEALISHEEGCSASCSEAVSAGNPSRGLLRWKQQCLRYDPALLRATSFCLEQHVRDQAKEQGFFQIQGPMGGKLSKDVARAGKQRRQQQQREKPFKKKRSLHGKQPGQHHKGDQRPVENRKLDYLHSKEKHDLLDIKEEQAFCKVSRSLHGVEGLGGGGSGPASGGRVYSREASSAQVKLPARAAGGSPAVSAPCSIRDQQTGILPNKHSNTAGEAGFERIEGGCKSTSKLKQQHCGFKRHKRIEKQRVRPD